MSVDVIVNAANINLQAVVAYVAQFLIQRVQISFKKYNV